MSEKMSENENGESCGACAVKSTRREFFREAALAAAGIVAALGMPARAQALSFLRASWMDGNNVAYPLPSADGVTIDKEHAIILVRHQGSVYAFALSCPHQRTALKWKEDDGRFQCPKHKSIYTPEGVFVEGRATRGLDRFAVRKDGNSIVVNLDSLFEQNKDADKWSKAFVTP